MLVEVKFLGSLERAAGRKRARVKVGGRSAKLKDVLNKLHEAFGLKVVEEAAGNYAIFVNGVEAGLLGGLEAKVEDGAEIIILPVVHGGS
ncbi:TPA: hypothetical protein EYP26_05345 [Candidatus Bathyarchaeota archaeon]|nr:hypothetical protein [Candidatus Bathyarchaeota archaeon]